MAHTGLGAEGQGIGNQLTRIGLPFLMRPVASGALPMLRAATDPTVLGEQFYGPRWRVFGPPVLETPGGQARDDDSARALWKASVELTGIDPSFSL